MAEARYEYRCWPLSVSGYEQRFSGGWQPCMPQHRTDIYLLPAVPMGAAEGTCLAKLRHGELLEIKRIMGHHGALERWEMAYRSEVSPESSVTSAIRRLLGVDFPTEPTGSARNLADRFAASATWRVVSVTKSRRKFVREDISGEITHVRFREQAYHTLAFESERAAPLAALVREWQLRPDQNMHYGRFLQSSDGQQILP